MDRLLDVYGVLSLIQTGENLQKDMETLQTEMDYIRLNNQGVSSDISNLVGQFEVIKKLVEPALQTTCQPDLGQEINAICTSLQVVLTFLRYLKSRLLDR